MMRGVLLVVAALGGLALAGPGDARELGQDEVRALSASGRSVALSTIYERIRRSTGGDPVDVRAFEAGEVYYRVLVMMQNGELGSVVVEARTGALLPPNSAAARQIRAEAAANRGNNGKGPGNASRGNNGNRGNSQDRGNSGNAGGGGGGGGGGDRGGDRGNSGGGGKK